MQTIRQSNTLKSFVFQDKSTINKFLELNYIKDKFKMKQENKAAI